MNGVFKFSDQYKQSAPKLYGARMNNAKSVSWESPANIALIKYWGKYENQMPRNPSLSFNLSNSKTITKVIYRIKENSESRIEYFFENKLNESFEAKVKNYFKNVAVYMPFINELDFKVFSSNTFPHSAGIASSASSYSALALCLCSIEQNLFHTLSDEKEFYRKASFLARLGSGSASRSIPGEAVLWGKTSLVNESSDEIAINVGNQAHDIFKLYHDAILVIDSGQKVVSSSGGHALMQNHPFAMARYKQANINLEKLFLALRSGSEKLFAEVVENEAMTLHALLLSSTPALQLMKPNTLVVIDKLIEFRKKHQLHFTFTLDAGPNVHILYPDKIQNKMFYFIKNKLLTCCENSYWIDDRISGSPKQINI